MKIAVIGSGNAGVISSIMSMYTNREYRQADPKITVFHDPKISTEIVGQGTTLNVSHAIHKVLNVDERFDNPVGITPKVGFFYKNWARGNKELLYKLGQNVSYHYDPKLLRNYFLKSDLFEFVEGHFTPKDISDDYDIIFDCRGKSCNNWDDYRTLENPVNCCLLGRSTGSRAHEVWTENIATPDGWCFKIPLSDGHSFGYVFNDEITSPEEAEKNFKEMFGVDTIHKVSFKNYLSKTLFGDTKKTVLNGNRLFFLEPLESTATPMYGLVAQSIVEACLEGSGHGIEDAVMRHITEVHEWIMWHYFYGSDYDTKFWRYAKDMSRSFNYSSEFKARIKHVFKTLTHDTHLYQAEFPEDMEGEFQLNDYAVWIFNNMKP